MGLSMATDTQLITAAEWNRHLEQVRDAKMAPAGRGKSWSQAFLTGQEETWHRDGGAMLRDAYAQSSWVYCAIQAIAETVAHIPFRISRGERGGEDVVEGEAINALFEQPHPRLNRYLFWELLLTWYCLRGESFIVALDRDSHVLDCHQLGRTARAARSAGAAPIDSLMILSPDMFWHIVIGYSLEGWRFTGQPLMSPLASQIFLPDEVLFDRKPNPWLFWRGLSPLTVAMLTAESDYAAAAFAKGYMMNNADQGIIVETDQQPSDEQRQQILAAMRERKRKAGTADRPLILWGGFKVARPPLAAIDTQFIAHRKLNRQEIAAIFRVPDVLMGFTEDANRAITEGQRLNFIENTVSPYCRRLEALLQPVVSAFGSDLYGWFDLDSLPILQQARRDRVATAAQLFSMGYPSNDINRVLDLGLPKLPWGDKGYLPFSLQQVTADAPAAPAAPGAPASGPAPAPGAPDQLPPDNGKSAAALDRAMDLLRLAPHVCSIPHSAFRTPHSATGLHHAAITASEKLKRGKLGKFFLGQRSRVLSSLYKVHKAAPDVSRFTDHVSRAIDDVFNSADENAKLKSTMRPMLLADLEAGGAQLFSEIGVSDFKVRPEDALAWLAQRENKITAINDTVFSEIKATLTEGLNAGDPFDALIDRVKAIYNAYGQDTANVERIAVTETNSAMNGGRDAAMRVAGVEKKAWQTSHLENTRQTHLEAEATSQDGIPIDQPFSNGLMYPGDPNGPPSETINCRCFVYALKGEGGAS